MTQRPDLTEIDREIVALRERLEDAEELRRAICDGEVDALVVGRDDEKIHVLVPHTDKADEAAATLEAIHRGEVDAFVVAGERVVTLQSALHPYQILADRMQQGAATLSADGEVMYANEKLTASMLKMPRTRVLGARLEDFTSPQDRGALAACLIAGRKGSAQGEIRLVADDGATVNVHLSVTSLGAGQVICLFSDLSLQKRHAATDERTRKFLGMLAHEFRGMLATIGYSAAYLKAGGNLDDKCREAVETIERQTQRLSALVEDLRSVNPRD
jgi:signal transduction histidine kinase